MLQGDHCAVGQGWGVQPAGALPDGAREARVRIRHRRKFVQVWTKLVERAERLHVDIMDVGSAGLVEKTRGAGAGAGCHGGGRGQKKRL